MEPDQLPPEAYERLAQTIFPGGKVAEVKPLHVGLSAQATLLEIQAPGRLPTKFVARRPPPWILKANPDAAVVEFQLLRALSATCIGSGIRLLF